MLSYELTDFETNSLKNLQAKIHQSALYVAKLSTAERAAIHRYAKISNIGASTRIENAVLTDLEVEWIDTLLSKDGHPSAFESHKAAIENKLSKDKERSIEEVGGCREMLQIIYEQGGAMRPFRENDLRSLHSLLMQHYPPAQAYIGNYKIAPNSVVSINHSTGEKKSILKTADPGHQTKIAVQTLLEWHNNEIEFNPWSLAAACEFVFRFLAIHPFQDGNGRVGRGLFLLSLLQCSDRDLNAIAPYIAMDRHIEQYRQDYYMSLRQCSDGIYNDDPKAYKINYFLRFMIRTMERSLEDIEFYHQKYLRYIALVPKTQAILNCFKDYPELRLSNQKIAEIMQIPDRTVRYQIQQLLKKEFLQAQGIRKGRRYQLIF
jgi:Fic family protein